MNLATLLLIIPPAVAITILAYLVRFLGKVITDQTPFADDRNWAIELSGLFFIMNNLVITAAVAVLFAITLPIPFPLIINFIIISLILGVLAIVGMAMTKKVYEINMPILDLITQKNKEREADWIKVGNFTSWFLLVAFYFIALEFISTNIYWSIVTSCQLFFILFYSAYIHSLRIYKPTKADIYFMNDPQGLLTMKKVTLLKVNPDNVRIKVGKNAMIINKSTVSKIVEIKSPKKHGKKKETKTA